MLAEKNSHPRDQYISFQELNHIYTLTSPDNNEIKHPISVTTLIGQYFPHFDADKVIEKMMKSKDWKTKKYYGQTPEEIKAGWDLNGKISSELGTKMHMNIEYFMDGKDVIDESDEFKMFLKFWDNFQKKYPDFKPYRLEWCVYDELFRNSKGLCGSIDCILSNEKGEIMIFDWKRSKEIKMTNKYEDALPPFKHMDNTNLSHYKIQLNIYRHILETKYHKKVVFMMLVILHPNQKGYNLIPVKKIDLTDIWDTL